HPPCPWPHRCRRQPDHLVPSSTPFLARCGLEALATVRVEEDTGAVPRSNRLCRLWGVAGSVPATGGCRSTARSHILPKFLDTRGVSRSSRTRGGMRWTRRRWARDVIAGRVSRERSGRADDRCFPPSPGFGGPALK